MYLSEYKTITFKHVRQLARHNIPISRYDLPPHGDGIEGFGRPGPCRTCLLIDRVALAQFCYIGIAQVHQRPDLLGHAQDARALVSVRLNHLVKPALDGIADALPILQMFYKVDATGTTGAVRLLVDRTHVNVAGLNTAFLAMGAVALTLAGMAGIRVAAHELIEVAGQAILLSRRFDREGEGRIPFLSALSMT